MTDIRPHPELEASLQRVAARLGHAGHDASRTVRRLRIERWWPIVSLIFALIVVAGAFWAKAWGPALIACWVVIPNRWRRVRERRAELDALLVDGDFLEVERKRVAKKLGWVRTAALLELLFVINFSLLAIFKPHLMWAYLTLAVLLSVSVAVRLAWVAPALQREFKDLGGEEEEGWLLTVLVFLFILIAPFMIVGGMIYRGVRRLLGKPVPEDEDEDAATEAGASKPESSQTEEHDSKPGDRP